MPTSPRQNPIRGCDVGLRFLAGAPVAPLPLPAVYALADLDELILAEPAAPMRRRLKKAVRRSNRTATILDATAERLPVDDGSVDTVVSTLVLCTVDRPVVALDEIKRVLRPDGRLLFLEHVRADSAWLAAWQDRLEKPWKRFAEGCRCNRATVELIEAAGFSVQHRSDGTWRAMPAIVRPIVLGSAAR
jgi:SAM-dependent methyltransferase